MKVDMTNFADFEVQGQNREGVMKRIKEQITNWGLRLPEVPYLIVDFGLGDFDNTGETEFWVSNEVEAGYCAKLIFVFNNQTCPYHYHKVKHETFYVLKGKVRIIVDGKELLKEAGDILVVTPGKKHSFTGVGSCLLLEASMPSIPGDSFFENKRIGKNGVI
jgi:N-acetylneuraminate synthase